MTFGFVLPGHMPLFCCDANFLAFVDFASFTKPSFSRVQHQQYFINGLFNVFASASSFITICLKITVTFLLSGFDFLAFFILIVDSLHVYNIGFLADDELSPSCIRRTVVFIVLKCVSVFVSCKQNRCLFAFSSPVFYFCHVFCFL